MCPRRCQGSCPNSEVDAPALRPGGVAETRRVRERAEKKAALPWMTRIFKRKWPAAGVEMSICDWLLTGSNRSGKQGRVRAEFRLLFGLTLA